MERHVTGKEIGRAPVVLTVPTVEKAFLCNVVATQQAENGQEHVRFPQEAAVTPALREHIDDVVAPLVEAVLHRLNVRTENWDITFEPLEAAAAHELPISVSGNSGDLPLFLALLSANLRLPLRQDTVTTGQFTSSTGRIGLVSHIPEKLRAAYNSRHVRRVLHPAFGVDKSLETLSPAQQGEIDATVAQVRRRLRVSTVCDVADLVCQVFDEEDLALSSLWKGYYAQSVDKTDSETCVGRAAQHLLEGNEKRFWYALRHALEAQDRDGAARLLTAYLQYHKMRGVYPSGSGARFMQRLLTLPPILRSTEHGPLVPLALCTSVAHYAEDSDSLDVEMLLRANRGRASFEKGDAAEEGSVVADEPGREEETYDRACDAILRQLSREHIAQSIEWPIDEARGSFKPESNIVASDREFTEALTAFYLHLLAGTGIVYTAEAHQTASGQAQALAERALHDQGGFKVGKAEARDGISGGLRTVLDRMTDQHKAETRRNHIQVVLGAALDGRDEDSQEKLVKALRRRCGGLLPQDIMDAEPRHLAVHWQTVFMVFAQALDKIGSALRNL